MFKDLIGSSVLEDSVYSLGRDLVWIVASVGIPYFATRWAYLQELREVQLRSELLTKLRDRRRREARESDGGGQNV